MQILFPHNQTAYEAACAMLVETGKACVIHPTGTGKSFIGFQLCADHPEAKVLWLSPSEYIFRTQLENWQSAGGSNLSNINFLTYAKLMLLSQAEIDALQPSIVVVDEFHRAGAAEWQKGVTRLLTAYPPAPPQKLSSFPKTNSAAGASTPSSLLPAKLRFAPAFYSVLPPPTSVIWIISATWQKNSSMGTSPQK